MRSWTGLALAVATLSLVACGGSGLRLAAVTPGIALDPHLDKEIHEAAAVYGPILSRWGRWEEDEWYAVRWCPNPDQIAANGGSEFSPYRTRGHWSTNESQSTYGAPPGSAYWTSDDGDTWGEMTMHHGWWVHLAASPQREWCWIPGREETAARVVWRSGEGFIGWAPESPTGVDDDGYDTLTVLDWSFTLIGSLLDLDLSSHVLEHDAREAARGSTVPHHGKNGDISNRGTSNRDNSSNGNERGNGNGFRSREAQGAGFRFAPSSSVAPVFRGSSSPSPRPSSSSHTVSSSGSSSSVSKPSSSSNSSSSGSHSTRHH